MTEAADAWGAGIGLCPFGAMSYGPGSVRLPEVSSGECVAVSGDCAGWVPISELVCSDIWPTGVFIVGCGMERNEGHLVDALALRGDEGRSTLR